MYPKLFNQPFLNSCGLSVSIGLIVCFAVSRHYVRVTQMNRNLARALEWNAYLSIIIGFGSAAVFQAWYDYIENPSAGFHLTKSVTILGGLIGGIGTFLAGYFAVVRRKYGPCLVEIGPVAPLCISIAQAFGRIGCFFGGCCYGKPTRSWLGVRFPNLGYEALPTQLFEAAFLFLLFAVLFHLVMRRNFKHSFALYMLAYGVFRFCIEFIRDDPRGKLVGALSPSQTISLLMVAGAVPVYFTMVHLLQGRSRKQAARGRKLMNTMQTTEERVIRAVGKIAKGRKVEAGSTFEELEIDSLSASEILFEIEDEFNIDIPDEGIRNIRGVSDVTRGVERLLAGEPADFGGENKIP